MGESFPLAAAVVAASSHGGQVVGNESPEHTGARLPWQKNS